ncbi:MAG: hypothetical protein N2645_12230 [Clostridia bacterium]|nr:hypothetical protein [Clostridia bacterium]
MGKNKKDLGSVKQETNKTQELEERSRVSKGFVKANPTKSK